MRSNRVPALCIIGQAAGDGGIARVSRLLTRVVQEVSQDAYELVELIPGAAARPSTYWDQLRFGSRVLGGQLSGSFDWLMFDHIGPATVQNFVPRSMRRPYGVFLYSIEIWRELSPTKLRIVQEACLRVAISQHTADRTLAAHPQIGHIDVCHLALPPESKSERQTPEAIDTELLGRVGSQAVLIVGRMEQTERHKGHDQLLRSWPAVKAKAPAAQLVVVGRGSDLDRLRDLAAKTGHGDSILFCNWVNEATLGALYERVALYAMPSKGEGFGLVFLEAMKHKLPCIASIHDASREIVVDGETGYLVDQENTEQLAAHILTLLGDPALRRAMGDAGYQRLGDSFSYERFSLRMNALMARLRG